MIGISLISLCIMAYNFLNFSFNLRYTDYRWYSYAAISIWFFPKIVIIPILFIKDLMVWITRLIRKYKSNFLNFKPKTHKIIRHTGWILTAIIFLIYTKAVFIDSRKTAVEQVSINIDNLNPKLKGLKIVQMSDIHAGSLQNENRMLKAAEVVNSLNPDLIFITGDFVNSNPNEYAIIERGIMALKAKYGKYAILGNHDHYMSDENHQKLTEKITHSGLKLLINENIKLNINNALVQLAGVDDLSFNNEYGNFNKALRGLNKDSLIIMMSHEPKTWKRYNLPERGVDLTLSGHTHGGQVKLDLLFTTILPGKLAYDELMGLYKYNGKYIYVNPGFGTTGPPVRIGIPPEITVITLE